MRSKFDDQDELDRMRLNQDLANLQKLISV
jgi:hypothetical protein